MLRLLVAVALALATLTISYIAKRYFEVDVTAVLPLALAFAVFGSVLFGFRKRRKFGLEDVQLGVVQGRGLVFSPVWLSSREHLLRVEALVSKVGWRERIFGFTQAKDMPHMRMPGFGAIVPLIFCAEGTLELVDGRLRFAARERKVEGFTLHNVDNDVTFDVSFSDITTLSPMEFHSPVVDGLTLHWIRLRGETEEADFDLLLSFGGFGVVPDILAQRTGVLRDALERELVLVRSVKHAAP